MDTIQKEMNVEKDSFLEESDVDPSIKDKLAVLYRTFDNRKRVRSSVFSSPNKKKIALHAQFRAADC